MAALLFTSSSWPDVLVGVATSVLAALTASSCVWALWKTERLTPTQEAQLRPLKGTRGAVYSILALSQLAIVGLRFLNNRFNYRSNADVQQASAFAAYFLVSVRVTC